jgi:hypothetical protein
VSYHVYSKNAQPNQKGVAKSKKDSANPKKIQPNQKRCSQIKKD